MSPRSLSILAALTSTDLEALVQAADLLFSRQDFAAAARAYAGLEVLDGRRYFTLRRAQAEARGGDIAGALKTLARLLGDEIAGTPTTLEGLRLRAALSSGDQAKADLALVEQLSPSTLSWA